jgi:hypothetical protein
MQYEIVRQGHSYIIVVEGKPLLRFENWRRAARTIAELHHPARLPRKPGNSPARTARRSGADAVSAKREKASA